MDGEQHTIHPLTGREVDILYLVALGLSNRDIAEELTLAPETVRWYTKQIYSKLGISGRIQAVNRARELGLLREGVQSTAATPIQSTPQHHLPIPITPFIGRGAELAEITRLLQTTRLLTLTGVGGTGKTRLALRLASAVADDFADGAYFVDLALISDHRLVAKTIASVLGVVANPAEPQLDTLKRALGSRELLLLLDNFEHVIEASPLVSELLAAAPRLKAIVTSRAALHLSGEQEYAVPPLSLSSAAYHHALDESEAVSLFVQRAQMVLPHFEITADNTLVVAEICARLDGLPLAIELAAARCKLLSPQAILSRLDSRLTTLTGGSRDAPLRQKTLRHTLDWSYNLLDEGEKKLFARLAVFRGGRSLDAIEAVCGPDLPLDLFDALASLVDKSLIQQKEAPGGEPRFVMLETIHEYARERLDASGELETIRRRHAEYFVELAERAEPELWLAKQVHWFQILEREQDNLRAALEWSLGGDVAVGLRMAGALWCFWHAYGHHAEGYHWTQQLLRRMGEAPVTCHAKFLVAAGRMSLKQFDLPTSQRLFRDALEISRKLGDKRQTAWALTCMSQTLFKEMDRANACAEEGLSLFRALDYEPGIQYTMNSLGEIARVNGDDRRARSAYDEALALARQMNATRQCLIAFANLSFIDQHEGHHTGAIDRMRQALMLCRQMKNNRDRANFIQILAGSLGAVGQPERAARLLGAAEAALERMGTFILTDQFELDRMIAAVRAQLHDTTFEAIWAEGRAMSLEQAVASVLDEPV